MKTLRVCPDNLRRVKQESLACGIASQSRKPLGSRMMMFACGWRRCESYSPLRGRSCARSLGGRCYRPCWIRRSRVNYEDLRVCPDNLRHVKQESLACGIAELVKETLRVSDDDVRAAGGVAGDLQSATGEELRPLWADVATVRAG